MMNVLFDISALGAGCYRHGSRTGVYRAIECLISHLLCRHDCRVSLTAAESLPLLAMARQYHSGDTPLKNAPFVSPEGTGVLAMTAFLEKLLEGQNSATVDGVRLLNRIASYLPLNLAALSASMISRYDVVHATYFNLPDRWRGPASPCRFQTVYDLIPLIIPQITTPAHRMITRRCIDSIQPDEWVLAISKATRDDLCEYSGFDPQRVFITPLAASDLFYRCTDKELMYAVRQRYGIPDAPYILSLCTLEPRKNIPHLIRCFADLVTQEQISDLNLVLVGTAGWQYEDIFRQIGLHSHLKDRIIVTGYLDDSHLSPLYSGALMFVYPSLYEGFGLPPLEAMQCGIPVITSDTSSLPEVVGDAGIMVPPEDKAGLCQAMLDIYRRPSLAEEYSTRSIARAGLFSWSRCAEQTLQAYQQALNCHKP
ncbi:MAG: glycosyltransferase family 1 protein [Geobacter sp.]|nr:glycosyltransferase family 1 protein [Geobacter sp.]